MTFTVEDRSRVRRFLALANALQFAYTDDGIEKPGAWDVLISILPTVREKMVHDLDRERFAEAESIIQKHGTLTTTQTAIDRLLNVALELL